MKQSISVYGFGSAFNEIGGARDTDLLIVHEDTHAASCQFAITCNEKISDAVPGAHITMLSKGEEAYFRFRQTARATFLGTVREDDLHADIALLVSNLPINVLPPGITYLPDFISSAEEAEIVSHLDAGHWSNELKRRVQHFGYRYDYKARRVTPESHLGPLPGWIAPLAKRLVSDEHFADTPDQVIANEYLPGQGISKHVDCEPCFGPVIASLSLLSPCEMVFRTLDGSAKAGIVLEPRSLVILSGEGRYDWTHEIPARQSDVVDGHRQPRDRRISLTFRKTIVGV